MGGDESSGFHLFCELTVKAFLACRPYVDAICATTQLMMGTDLPSFKGEPTIDRLRDRFKPEMTDHQAADYIRSVINNAKFSAWSRAYDQFQLRTNAIPCTSATLTPLPSISQSTFQTPSSGSNARDNLPLRFSILVFIQHVCLPTIEPFCPNPTLRMHA